MCFMQCQSVKLLRLRSGKGFLNAKQFQLIYSVTINKFQTYYSQQGIVAISSHGK